jgi:signal transduction histidine kinase
LVNLPLLMSNSESPESLDDVRETVSSVYHDLNNPLSIISGNAQFLLELTREEDVDEQFVSSVRDIKQAAERMSDSLNRLTRLKEDLEEAS